MGTYPGFVVCQITCLLHTLISLSAPAHSTELSSLELQAKMKQHCTSIREVCLPNFLQLQRKECENSIRLLSRQTDRKGEVDILIQITIIIYQEMQTKCTQTPEATVKVSRFCVDM